MNKKEVARRVADKLNMSAADMEVIFDAINSEVVTALARGDRITIWNFGRIETRMSSERVGRAFATGETIKIPPRRKVIFTPSPTLVEEIERLVEPAS